MKFSSEQPKSAVAQSENRLGTKAKAIRATDDGSLAADNEQVGVMTTKEEQLPDGRTKTTGEDFERSLVGDGFTPWSVEESVGYGQMGGVAHDSSLERAQQGSVDVLTLRADEQTTTTGAANMLRQAGL